MDYKTINYNLTVSVSSKEAVSIIQLLTEDYKDLFKKCNITITQTNNPKYTDLIVLNLEFSNGLYAELTDFESDLVKNNLLPIQFKIFKECK